MSWYRRWGIIAALAVAQVGVIIGYHSFLSGNGSHARAAAQEQSSEKPPVADNPEPKQYPLVRQGSSLEKLHLFEANAELKQLPPASPDTKKEASLPIPSVPPMAGGSGVVLPPVTLVPVSAVEKTTVIEKKGLADDKVAPVTTQAPPPGLIQPVVPSVTPPLPPTVPMVPPVVSDFGGPAPPLKDKAPKDTTPVIVPVKHQTQVGPCPWTLRIEIVNGKTQLSASIGKEVQFRVACEKLDLQAPRGIIDATGSVTVSSDGLDGTCERLQITWAEEHVILEGKAQLKCQRDGQEVELKAERLSLRLTANGIVPVRTPNTRTPLPTNEPPVQSKKSTPSTSVPVVDVPSGVTVGGATPNMTTPSVGPAGVLPAGPSKIQD